MQRGAKTPKYVRGVCLESGGGSTNGHAPSTGGTSGSYGEDDDDVAMDDGR